MDCRRVQSGFEMSVQLFLLRVWYRILPVRVRKNFFARRGPCFQRIQTGYVSACCLWQLVSIGRMEPHPTCTCPKKIFRSERALLPAHSGGIRFSLLPMVYPYEGDKLCAKKERLQGFGYFAISNEVISLVSDFRKLSPALPFDLLTKSLNIWGITLSGSAADPFGKDIIDLYRMNLVTKKLPEFSGFWAANWLAEGAFDNKLVSTLRLSLWRR